MKFLIVKLSALGDQIHLCPAVSDLARCYPGSTIHWIAQTECAAIPEMHLDVTKVFRLPLQELRSRPWSLQAWTDFLSCLQELRRNSYDLVIDAQGVLKSAIVSRIARRAKVFGYASENVSEHGANWFYSESFKPTQGISAVARAQGLIGAAIGCPPSGEVRYRLTTKNATSLLEDLDRSILLIPCASSEGKQWSATNWARLIGSLGEYSGHLNLIWGSDKEREHVSHIANMVSCKAKPLAYRHSIPELVRLMKGSKLVIGVDSGITHLANAVGTPTIMLFMSTRPNLFFERGSTFSSSQGDHGVAPEVESVIETAIKILRQTSETVNKNSCSAEL